MGIEGQNQNLKRSVIQGKPGNNVIIILFFATVQVILLSMLILIVNRQELDSGHVASRSKLL